MMNRFAPLFLLALLPVLPAATVAASAELDTIVAIVEDDVILRSELDRELDATRGRLRASGKPVPSADEVERLALESLIMTRLQTAAAERSGVTVTDAEVDNAIAGIAERNGLTMDQLKEVLHRSGMNYESFRKDIRKQLFEVAFQRQQIGGKIQVSDSEIDRYLEQHGGGGAGAGKVVTQTHARHILIRTGERTSDREAEERLNKLRARIQNGEDFATLARASSDDTASALKGGDLGWVNPGDTTPDFERQLATLEINVVSQPFKSPYGWHIVQVLERRQENIADQARRDEAAAKIRERKAKEALEFLARQLRDQAYVEVRLGDPDRDSR